MKKGYEHRITVYNDEKIVFDNKVYNLEEYQATIEEFIVNEKRQKDKITLALKIDDDAKVALMKEVKIPIRKHNKFVNLVVFSSKGKESIVRLPPYTKTQPDYGKLRKRNLLIFYLNKNGMIYRDTIAYRNPILISDVNKTAYEFLRNPNSEEDLPEMKEKDVDTIGRVKCASKSIIILRSSNKAKYKNYLQLYDELKSVYQKIWDEDSIKYFGKNYNSLTTEKQKIIKTVTPYVLSEI